MAPPGLGSWLCPLGLGSVVAPLCGVSGVRWPSVGSVPCGVRLGPSSRVLGRLGCSPFALGGLAVLAFSSSSVEWRGTFRHQPCGFRVFACRRLYSRLSPSPLCASPRALSALRSPSGFGSRSKSYPRHCPAPCLAFQIYRSSVRHFWMYICVSISLILRFRPVESAPLASWGMCYP